MTNEYLEDIYKQYYNQLFLYAFSLAQNKADAEDLVANTFVKAFLSFRGGHLKAWLYIVLKNEYLNMCKKKRKWLDEGKIDLNNISSPSFILKTLIKEEQKRWLYEQIFLLNRVEREILLLSLQDDLTDKMIAEMLNLSIENVRVIKHRAKKKLIEKYKEEISHG